MNNRTETLLPAATNPHRVHALVSAVEYPHRNMQPRLPQPPQRNRPLFWAVHWADDTWSLFPTDQWSFEDMKRLKNVAYTFRHGQFVPDIRTGSNVTELLTV